MKRLLWILLLVELGYLVLVNGALRLPLTQDLVNRIRPDRYHVEWQRAWSWYPFRFHAVGVRGHGQSRRQQWQFSAARAAGSIALTPLLLKRVWLRNVSGTDIDYRQRPRLKEGVDYSHLLPLFPPIEGRGIAPVDDSPYRSRRPWRVSISGAEVSGTHRLWVYQARGEVRGRAAGRMSMESRRGRFSMEVTELDAEFRGMSFSEDYPVFERGRINGSLGFAPFVRREHPGPGVLRYLWADVEVDVAPVTLEFIDLFTLNLDGVSVDGNGAVSGRLRCEGGQVLPGTDLRVAAPDLAVTLADHRIAGNGTVGLRLGPETEGDLDLVFDFDELEARHREEPGPLLAGRGLTLRIGGDGRVLPDPERRNQSRSLGFAIDDLAVPDLARLQRYLPARWPLALRGGEGRLSGSARLAPTALDVALRLTSERAEAALRDYRFETDIDALLMLSNPALAAQRTRVSGSRIRLSGAQLRRDDRPDAAAWEAWLDIPEGEFGLLAEERRAEGDTAVDLLQLLARTGARELLDESRGRFRFEAGITDLAWLGLFLGGDFDTAVSGDGSLSGVARLEAGMPAPGTEVTVSSPDLGLDFLDYRARGDGRARLAVEEGGPAPDWSVGIDLRDGVLRRRGDAVDTLREVQLSARALVEDLSLRPGGREGSGSQLRLLIERARLQDMRVFNRYLPEETGFRFSGGGADISTDLLLRPEDATGWLRLEATRIGARLEGQQLEGDLLADLTIAGGIPRAMQFDLSGSRLLLDEVRVTGANRQFDSAAWRAALELERAHTRWTRPPALQAEAVLRVSDSRPFVAMFDNRGWRPELVNRMLTVEDIRGRATLELADRRLLVPDARLLGEEIEAAARGVFGEGARRGMVYLRYRKADALLKVDGDRRNLDVLRARETFEGYRAGDRP